MCDMTHSYARHDSFIPPHTHTTSSTPPPHTTPTPPPTQTPSSTPPHTHTLSLSPTHTCDDTTPQESPWSIARDSCARNSLHLWNMTHLCMGRDSFMSVTSLSHVWERCACAWNRLSCFGIWRDVTHPWVWHNPVIHIWVRVCMCLMCTKCHVIKNVQTCHTYRIHLIFQGAWR